MDGKVNTSFVGTWNKVGQVRRGMNQRSQLYRSAVFNNSV